MDTKIWAALAASAVMVGGSAQAAYVVETEISNVDDNDVTTPDPNFSFGGDTTNASESVPSPAVGITSGVSIFGGNGSAEPDTYLYSYTPGTDADNRVIAAGTALNDDGDVVSGLAGGGSGLYRVYATWPQAANMSGGITTYTISDGSSDLASVQVIQNEDITATPLVAASIPVPAGDKGLDGNQKGGEWEFLFEVALIAGETYTVSQVTTENGFVSMRSSGVLFNAVPEPTTAALGVAALLGVGLRRRTR
ncbi:MAG: PEP-CTERM sorting domain-containing protein [Planctomycetota bacterium]